LDMKLEVVVLPVSDVDRAKRFYGSLEGWRLDADVSAGDGFRVVQLTRPGSPGLVRRVHGSRAVRQPAADMSSSPVMLPNTFVQ
jgi:catechol 2,3-dioxygenase-like lactoylglutathione lyase family enzyme